MADTGTLFIRVYTSAAELPLQGALVTVTGAAPGGGYELLSTQRTDSSGLVTPIRLSTPELSLGTSPAAPGVYPYSSYTVWVEMPGYLHAVLRNVQLFPGIESILDVNLIPLDQAPAGRSGQNTGR